MVLAQVLRLSHATEGVQRGEHRQDVLWDIKFSAAERFQTKPLVKGHSSSFGSSLFSVR